MRNTRVTKIEPAHEHRYEIGVDVPCHICKMKGETYDSGKAKKCARCEGRGFLTNKSASESRQEE